KQEFPEIPENTIQGHVWNLETKFPEEIYKAARGLFKHVRYRAQMEEEVHIPPTPPKIKDKIQEEDFYKPFADWLVDEEECTNAIPLGGNKFKGKWGTPDVIGISEPRKSDIIKLPTEIVSAEIKIDIKDLITAFGQACSYKLFSNRSYIVIPNSSTEEDIKRIEALCIILGLGLILFDNQKVENPNFVRKVPARKHEPDMFYANQFIKLVENELFD
ncbi:MAG: hypothetical protein A2145_00720, partial [candidate division Zixibacteria bacterium RBG_16_40_9]